ncbi:MAG: AAA family ATPase [Nocardioidaceae bacterium]
MTVTVLLAGADEPWETPLVRALSASPGIALTRRCVDVADAVATAASGQVRVALLTVGMRGLDTDVVRRILDAGVQLVAVTDSDDAGAAARAVALGMIATVAGDDVPAVVRAVVAADERRRSDQLDGFDDPEAPGPDGTERGRLIVVWGPTGAPGRSTVALGVASETAGLGVPTLLIDADVYGGSVGQMLAMLDEVSGLLAAARSANTGRLDLDELGRHVRQINPTLRILTGLPRPDRWSALRPGSFDAVLTVARQMAPVVVVDVGFNLELDEELSFDTAAPRRNGATLAALEQADDIIVVGSADPLGLARLTRGIFELREAVPGAQLHVVVNKVRDSLGWSRGAITDTVHRLAGVSPSQFLPLDQSAVDRAWVNGRSLAECARDSPLRVPLTQLARTVAPAGTAPREGITRRRRRRDVTV